MSSDLFPTVKSKKHIEIALSGDAMAALKKEARREDRSYSKTVSRILEERYEEQSKTKV